MLAIFLFLNACCCSRMLLVVPECRPYQIFSSFCTADCVLQIFSLHSPSHFYVAQEARRHITCLLPLHQRAMDCHHVLLHRERECVCVSVCVCEWSEATCKTVICLRWDQILQASNCQNKKSITLAGYSLVKTLSGVKVEFFFSFFKSVYVTPFGLVTGHACVNQKLVFHCAAQKCLLDMGLLCESGVTETLVSLLCVPVCVWTKKLKLGDSKTLIRDWTLCVSQEGFTFCGS